MLHLSCCSPHPVQYILPEFSHVQAVRGHGMCRKQGGLKLWTCLLGYGATAWKLDVMKAVEKGDYYLAGMLAETDGGDSTSYLLQALSNRACHLEDEVDKLRSELAAALKQQVTSADTCECACCLLHLSMSALMLSQPCPNAMLCGRACVLHAP